MRGSGVVMPTTGSVLEVMKNQDELYEGNLVEYFSVIVDSPNFFAPYHNGRHMLHVPVMCYSALLYYRLIGKGVDHSSARDLVMAGLIHDFDHTAEDVDDDVNIERARRGLRAHILRKDAHRIPHIDSLTLTTRYPYKEMGNEVPFLARILRDADKSQAFSTAWILQVAGLGKEKGWTFKQTMENQLTFLHNLSFDTEWGKFMFGPKQIREKIRETEGILSMLP